MEGALGAAKILPNIFCGAESPSLNTIGEPADEQLFSANFIFATIANLFNACGSQMMNTAVPMYVLSIGGTSAEAGLVSGIVAIMALVLRPLIGWVTDAWKRRPIALIGSSFYGIAGIIIALSNSIGTMVLGRLVHGIGISCYSTASNSYVADIAPPKRRAEAIGIFAATNSLGLIIGPAIGFYIVARLGFHWLFYVTVSLAVIACIVSLFAKEKQRPRASQRQSWSWRTGILAVDSLPIAWIALCLGMTYGSITAFIAIFASSRGIENPGFYFTIQAIMILIARVFSGRFADKYGRAFMIIPGIIAMSLALALLPLAQEFSVFVISAVLMGMGVGVAQPSTMALLVDQVQSDKRGLAMATYFMGYDGGVFLGSVVFGLVSQVWGFNIMWYLAAGWVLLGLLGLSGARKSPSATT
jgi:MFS family permease